MNKLFIVMSHTLTDAQIDDFIANYGTTEFVTLQDVNPELSKLCQNLDPRLSTANIRELAVTICSIASSEKATHLYIAGEPSLVFWVSMYAEKLWSAPYINKMTCVQSTTKRISKDIPQPDGSVKKISSFSHVQWRELL